MGMLLKQLLNLKCIESISLFLLQDIKGSDQFLQQLSNFLHRYQYSDENLDNLKSVVTSVLLNIDNIQVVLKDFGFEAEISVEITGMLFAEDRLLDFYNIADDFDSKI